MKPKDDEKFKAITEATFVLVEQTGLSGLTMAAIARQAGLATGTLYVYFKSKEELVNALYAQAKTATAARVLQGDDPDAPFRVRFRHTWNNLLKNRLDYWAEMVFQEQYYNSPWFSEANRDLSARLFRDWFLLIEKAKEQQILKNVPTPLLTSSLMGSVRETASLIRAGQLTDSEADLAMAFGLCWDGIKA